MLFAVAKDILGGEQIEIELPNCGTLADLKIELAKAFPQVAEISNHSMFAVNDEYVSDETPLSEVSEIAMIPPVSGG